MNLIAIRISEAARAKNISTRQLGEITGIPKSAIQRYVDGTTERIPIDRLKLIASALNVTAAYLMGIETEDGESVDVNISDERAEKIRQITCIAERLPPEKLATAQAVLQALADNL